MAHPASEIVTLSLIEGATIESEASGAGSIFQQALATIRSAHGFQNQYWGYQVENPGTVNWIIDWDSVEAHKSFMETEGYDSFVETLSKILSSPPVLLHVHFDPYPPSKAVSSESTPVTEVVTFYFPLSITHAEKAAFSESFSSFKATLKQKAEGFTEATGGWVAEGEELDHHTLGKSTAFVAVIGWVSIEEHMNYRETEAFKTTIVQLRDKVKATEMHHVIFNRV